MGLKYYLNLFKKDSNNEVVKLRYFLNIFVFLVYMVLFMAFTALRETEPIASAVFGMLALCAVVVNRFLSATFSTLICKLIDEEQLGKTEVDRAIQAYRGGYMEYYASTRRLSKWLLPLNILSICLLVAILPLTIVLNLLGSPALPLVSSITMYAVLGYLVILIGICLYEARKGLWYQSYTVELEIINGYKSEMGEVSYRITEDKKQNVQLDYLIPNAELRTRLKKLQKITHILNAVFFSCLVLGMIAFTIVTSTLGETEEINSLLPLIPIAGGALLVVWVSLLVTISVLQSKIISTQRRLLEENAEENSLHLRLHNLRTPFIKRWNVLFGVLFLGIILVNILFAGIVSVVAKTDAFGWIFTLLIIAEIIAMFVVYFKQYGRVRMKMIAIENKIDAAKKESMKEETQSK